MEDTLVSFLIYLNEKGLINNYEFDFEKESINFINETKI